MTPLHLERSDGGALLTKHGYPTIPLSPDELQWLRISIIAMSAAVPAPAPVAPAVSVDTCSGCSRCKHTELFEE